MLIFGIADSDSADDDNDKMYKAKKTLVVSEDNTSEPLDNNTAGISSSKKKLSKKPKVSNVATSLHPTFADRILKTTIVIPDNSSDVTIEEITATNSGPKAKKA
jgi:hypothetical protein